MKKFLFTLLRLNAVIDGLRADIYAKPSRIDVDRRFASIEQCADSRFAAVARELDATTTNVDVKFANVDRRFADRPTKADLVIMNSELSARIDALEARLAKLELPTKIEAVTTGKKTLNQAREELGLTTLKSTVNAPQKPADGKQPRKANPKAKKASVTDKTGCEAVVEKVK